MGSPHRRLAARKKGRGLRLLKVKMGVILWGKQKYVYGYGEINGSGDPDTSKNNGQLGKIESWIGTNKQWTQRFSYDHIGRLKQSEERRGDTNALTYKQVFDFDRFGNMYRNERVGKGQACVRLSQIQCNPRPSVCADPKVVLS